MEPQYEIEFCQSQANMLERRRQQIQSTIAELQDVDKDLAMQQSRLYEHAARLGAVVLGLPEQRSES